LGLVEVFALPTHLRAASERMAEVLRGSEFDALFLNISRRLNKLVKALAEGAPYEEFIERAREEALIPEPLSSWEYAEKPILLAVKGILNERPELEIWCYKRPEAVQLSVRVAEEIARLVLRTCLTGKVDLDEWRSLLRRFSEASAGFLEDEAEYVAERARGKERAICISGINGRRLKEHLSRCKVKASLSYPVVPYHLTPIEVLVREVERERRSSVEDDERIIKIIRYHVNFVRNYILTSRTYDEAYFKWVKHVVSWMRFKKVPLPKAYTIEGLPKF